MNNTLRCPSCDSNKISTEEINHCFPYGQGELSANVPLRKCQNCGEQYLDHEAEELMGVAIRLHLNTIETEYPIA